MKVLPIRLMIAHVAILFSVALASELFAAQWHHPLSLHRGGHWAKRLTVKIVNEADRAAEGAPVPMKLETGHTAADLIGARAGRVRVCDSSGTEMLFRVSDPDGVLLQRGPIPSGSTLVLPAECPPGESTTYYVYYENPRAWPVPDFLEAHLGVVNGGAEAGSDGSPLGWDADAGDDRHRLSWTTDHPHSGNKCLKTVVASDAEPTWIAHRQRQIHISGGAKYRMTAWVRADDVKGFAGWYLHVGNDQDPMIHSGMLRGGDGTYGWTKVATTFTAPEEATGASLGTVLRGTGSAWFDDVSLELLEGRSLTATVTDFEELTLECVGENPNWRGAAERWPYRCSLQLANATGQPQSGLALVNLHRFTLRLRRDGEGGSVQLLDEQHALGHKQIGEMVAFPVDLPAKTAKTCYAYFAGEASDGEDASGEYRGLLRSDHNLVQAPGFEAEGNSLSAWEGGRTGGDVTASVDEGALRDDP